MTALVSGTRQQRLTTHFLVLHPIDEKSGTLGANLQPSFYIRTLGRRAITPPIAEIICVKIVRAFVVCVFIFR